MALDDLLARVERAAGTPGTADIPTDVPPNPLQTLGGTAGTAGTEQNDKGVSFSSETPLTDTAPPTRASLKLHDVLEQFKFDLVETDIAGGAPAAELDRLNNLTFELIQADGLPFDEAMQIAASIVVTCEPLPCEAGYTDLRSLWRYGMGGYSFPYLPLPHLPVFPLPLEGEAGNFGPRNHLTQSNADSPRAQASSAVAGALTC